MRPSELIESSSFDQTARFQCFFCPKWFSHKRSRDRHTKLHTGETKYKCELCDNAFIRSDHLKSHMKTHDLAKPFQCPSCNCGYATSAALTSHMQHHKSPNQLAKKLKHFVKYQAGILPTVNQQIVSTLVKCNINLNLDLISSAINPLPAVASPPLAAAAANYNGSQLFGAMKAQDELSAASAANPANQIINSNKRNLMSSNPVNPTNYNLTNKRRKLSIDSMETEDTASSAGLSDMDDDMESGNLFDKHELIDVCNSSLNQSSDFKSQTKLNKDDQQQIFYCTVCNGEFAHKRSLDRHLKIHTGDKKFKCDYCEQSYSRSDHLKNHLKSNHKISRQIVDKASTLDFLDDCSNKSNEVSVHNETSSLNDKPKASTVFNIEKLLSLPSSTTTKNETRVLSSSLSSSSSSSSCSSPNLAAAGLTSHLSPNEPINPNALTSSSVPFNNSPLLNGKDSLLYQNYLYLYYNHYHYYQRLNETSKLFPYPY